MNPVARISRRGVTLVEVLVVIGLIGLLVGLLMSAVQSARGAAARIACTNSLRQLGIASQHYHDQHKSFPPAYASLLSGPQNYDRVVGWPVHLLPFIEQDNLWAQSLEAHRIERYDFNNPPHIGLSTVVKVYTCHADDRLRSPITDDKGYTAAYGSYMGVAGGRNEGDDGLPVEQRGAMWPRKGVRIAEITDGSSNTLLIGERPPPGRLLSGAWYSMTVPDPALVNDPGYAGGGISYMSVYIAHNQQACQGPFQFGPGRLDNPCDVHHFWSLHSGGANFLFADGSVHFLRYAARDILPALATRAGGEVVTLPD